MPRLSNNKKDDGKKMCVECKKNLSIINFYSTESKMFPDGKSPVCKNCIRKEVNNGGIDAVKRVLRQIDRPFIAAEWNRSVASGKEPFGWYLRQISSLPQYQGQGYEDSFGEDQKTFSSLGEMEEEELYGTPEIEVKRKWGLGYSNKEYYELEKTWHEMIRANDITTPQHITNLELYCQLKVKTKRALENDNVGDFDKLNKQFQEISKNSGFRPIDRVAGNESAGIRSFSTIFEEVERDGFIEPYKIEEHQDIVDRTIMYLANYTRKLLQMEQLHSPPEDTPKVGE